MNRHGRFESFIRLMWLWPIHVLTELRFKLGSVMAKRYANAFSTLGMNPEIFPDEIYEEVSSIERELEVVDDNSQGIDPYSSKFEMLVVVRAQISKRYMRTCRKSARICRGFIAKYKLALLKEVITPWIFLNRNECNKRNARR